MSASQRVRWSRRTGSRVTPARLVGVDEQADRQLARPVDARAVVIVGSSLRVDMYGSPDVNCGCARTHVVGARRRRPRCGPRARRAAPSGGPGRPPAGRRTRPRAASCPRSRARSGTAGRAGGGAAARPPSGASSATVSTLKKPATIIAPNRSMPVALRTGAGRAGRRRRPSARANVGHCHAPRSRQRNRRNRTDSTIVSVKRNPPSNRLIGERRTRAASGDPARSDPARHLAIPGGAQTPEGREPPDGD